MRMATIASGSSGNCTYIGTEQTHILIDAGISMRRIREGLHALDLDLKDIDAIFVTHEHSDHIQGLPMISRHYGIPLYATAGTFVGIRLCSGGDKIDASLMHTVRAEEEVQAKDLVLTPMAISHDTREPVAYKIRQGDHSVAVATDLGCFDERLVGHLTGLDALVLESNHDIRMLQAGPYPYQLKQRILGEKGHLSNDAASELLNRILHDRLKGIFLGHLSEMNNLPELAYETARVGIELSDTPYHGDDFPLHVAPRSELSEILEV